MQVRGAASRRGSRTLGPNKSPAYVYIGDRYNVNDLNTSTYVYLPLYIEDDTAGESGILGSGNITLSFNPDTPIDVAHKCIDPPSWELLSLHKPVTATPSTPLTAAEVAAGTYNYSAAVANDGIDYDVDAYDDVVQFYLPNTVPYYWQVDLKSPSHLSWIGLSFRSVSGSDCVERYTLYGSKDNETWVELVDNTDNDNPGYKSHIVSGTYRYVRLNTSSVYDIVHDTEATWEVGLYEASIYGTK